MSYGKYNESLYRTGFRPYLQTDAFAASQMLSGYPSASGLGQSNAFGPWKLHGDLGQSHPFTERGGWALHGLGAMVPDGSLITYNGKWTPTGTMGAQDVIQAVSSNLESDGLPVRNSSNDASWLQNTPPFPLNVGPFNVQLQIQVNTGQGGFGQPQDIISIIRHEVYTVTGMMPLADSIPSMQPPGGGGPISTGMPPGPGTPGTGTSFTAWLEQNALWIGLGLAGLVLLPSLTRRFL